MGNKFKIGIAAAGVIVMVIGCFWFLFSPNPEKASIPLKPLAEKARPPETTTDHPSPPAPVKADAGAHTPDDDKSLIENQIVKELIKNYGNTIADTATQAVLFGIRAYIRSLFLEDGDKVFLRILRRAFPDFADAVMATLGKLDLYNQWLTDNEAMLAQLPEGEKNAALWQKREELFGEDAKEIWSGELLASDARKKTMQDMMGMLSESRDTTIEEKLDMFTTALRDTYENSPEEYVLGYKDMSAKVFFSLDSVQEDLKKLPPDQRQFEINKIRREMGFSQEEIEKMEEYDAVRNQRWENGLTYMTEREALAARFNGPELEEKLKSLREKYFQDEAGTIELEEKDNFFRFKRERVYGRN